MILRKVTSGSTHYERNLEFEFLLMWISEGGGVRQWLFSHTDGDRDFDFENEIIETSTSIRSVQSEESKEVDLVTGTLTKGDYNYVKSLLRSPRVYLVDKQNNRTPVAIKGSNSREKKNKDFQIACKIVFKEPPLMNV